MSDDSLPEPDRVLGAPHPRDTSRLVGQDTAEASFLEAYNTGRLHHGWLMIGPRGTGKATLAYRIARFLLSQPNDDGGMFGAPEAPTTLETNPENPVARRMAAGAEPGLFVLRRPVDEKTKRLKSAITVDEVRKLKNFFAMSSADGGRRVVIVDAADEMNVNAANAILKLLEEPPERATLLLVSHQPSRLLPTIRSRCRELRLVPLNDADMAQALKQALPETDLDQSALSALTSGSVGEAIRMTNLSGPAIYAELVGLLASLPRMDRSRALRLADAAAQRGAEDKLDMLVDLIALALARLARAGTLGVTPTPEATQGESEMIARLSPNPRQARRWAEVAQEVDAKLRHGRAVNLDPAALILDTLKLISQAAV
ncbi:MAG: DNA polymerase III subunit delta' [Planktotalea sp.]|uniref:DNA polymerase III subunit delta' n=1 Tax=Planktotalea sp. TaxID=2029877 RepID=UPI003C767CD3